MIELNPGSVVALNSAANIYRRKGDYDKAIKYYKQILKINPLDPYAWHGKADCLRGKREYRLSIEAWRNALKNGMDPRIALTRVGDAYVYLDELDEAESYYKQALLLGYDKYAHLGMVKIYLKKAETSQAYNTLVMLKKKEPKDTRISYEIKKFLKNHPEFNMP